MLCPGPFHFSHSVDYIYISMSFVLSLTEMLVFLSLYVMLSILLSILVCAAANFFCAIAAVEMTFKSYGGATMRK